MEVKCKSKRLNQTRRDLKL